MKGCKFKSYQGHHIELKIALKSFYVFLHLIYYNRLHLLVYMYFLYAITYTKK